MPLDEERGIRRKVYVIFADSDFTAGDDRESQ